MNEHYQWHILAHSALKPAEKLEVLRLTSANLTENLSMVPENQKRVLSEAANAEEAFLLEELLNQGGSVVLGKDPLYPTRLKKHLVKQTPLLLYNFGNPELFNVPKTIAVVGSRDASDETLHLVDRACRFLAHAGFLVVSGMARGVDTVALEATLQHGGRSIAFLPQGVLAPPSRSATRKYYSALLDGQLLLSSELHPNTKWQARFAMMRNRLIMAEADVVLVAQTGLKETLVKGKKQSSGTWQGAEQAHKMGKPIFVLDLPFEGNQAMGHAFGRRLQISTDDSMFEVLDQLSPPVKPTQGRLL